MTSFQTLLCLPALLISLSLHAQSKPQSAAPKRQVSPILKAIEDKPGLPRVLLIGDSISMGYTLPVRRALEGQANVHRIPANGGDTKKGLQLLDGWLGDGHWDIIHFNFGIHDRKTPLKDYEQRLETRLQIVFRFLDRQPGLALP